MPKSPGEMQDAIVRRLKERTGKSVDEWGEIARTQGPESRKLRVDWLMREHGLGRVAANMAAAAAEGARPRYSDQAGLFKALFAGSKAGLKPVFDAVLDYARSLGPDVDVYAAKTQATLRRNRQFAWLKPATPTRLDLGLALGDKKPGGRLLPVSGTNDKDRVRLRIPLASPAEVDAEVKRWLKAAYDLDQ